MINNEKKTLRFVTHTFVADVTNIIIYDFKSCIIILTIFCIEYDDLSLLSDSMYEHVYYSYLYLIYSPISRVTKKKKTPIYSGVISVVDRARAK